MMRYPNKFQAIQAVLLAVAAEFVTAAASDSEIVFANGDRLAGSLESFAVDHLIWNSPALEKATPFQLSKIMDLRLPGSPVVNPGAYEVILNLTNGDVAKGRIAMVNEKAVVLETIFGGRLAFNRAMISAARIEQSKQVVYRGPSGMEGWHHLGENEVWSCSRSALHSSGLGGIGRDNLLPDACAIAFDAEWKGDSCNLMVVVYANDSEVEPATSGYELTIQRGNIRLRNCATQNFIGSVTSPLLGIANKARIEIRATRLSGTFCLLINDRVAEVWTDPDWKKMSFGDGLRFISLSEQAHKISAIRVGRWDGVVEGLPDDQSAEGPQPPKALFQSSSAAKENPREDGMYMTNGDFVSGELSAVEGDQVGVKSSLGELKLPIERLRGLALKPANPERAIRRNGDIRVYFVDGSRLVMCLDGVEEGRLLGTSQNFGEALFGLDLIERIEFNIYDPALERKRMSEPW